MPELPDVTVYVEALQTRILNAPLLGVRLANPFVLRSVAPPLGAAAGRTVSEVRRLGKRIVIALEGELFLVVHLMIAGRLHWKRAGAKPAGKYGLAAFDFSAGTLVLTEAGSKRRAALHLVQGEPALREHDPGGLDRAHGRRARPRRPASRRRLRESVRPIRPGRRRASIPAEPLGRSSEPRR